jgi:hypothetical protein
MRLFEPFEKLTDQRTGEPSTTIRDSVEPARERQWERFAASERLVAEADMSVSHTLRGT